MFFGFNMESHTLIGPALPPTFKKKENDDDSEEETACKNETYFVIDVI